MLFIQTEDKIIQIHCATRSIALEILPSYDFTYAEWCGSELKSTDLYRR